MSSETQVSELVKAYCAQIDTHRYAAIKPDSLPAGLAILEAPPQAQIAVIRACLDQTFEEENRWYILRHLHALLVQLSKRNLPYTLEDIQAVLHALAREYIYHEFPVQAILRSLERHLADPAMLAACTPALEQVRKNAQDWYDCADKRRFLRLVDDILGGQRGKEARIAYDHWGKQVLPYLDEMDEETRKHWLSLLQYCAASSGTKPSAKWLAQAHQSCSELGEQTFERLAYEWIGIFAKKHNERLDEGNANILRGLIWCCGKSVSAPIATILGDAAIEGYRKLPGLGPRAPRIAGACVYVLKLMPDLQGIAQLERARLNVKQSSFLKGIEKALEEAAQRKGMSREDLEELTIPTFDLRDGKRRVTIGEAVVEIEVVGLDVRNQWYDAAGKPRKTVPAEVKREHKQELKDFKRLCDDLQHMLIAHRERVERLPLTERTWSLSNWRERYLEHPLVGLVARRLIWRFRDGERVVDGIWHEGQLLDAHDTPLEGLSDATVVSSWHPVHCDVEEVRAWRAWFERHQITQPFKQAHREVYLLTDAERNTRTYSNRFAAHILRQHQFNALALGRGWQNQLRLMVDDSYPPASLNLSRWGLRAEFWIEGAGDDYGHDTNASGTYLYLSTDQVRFYRTGAPTNYAHAGGGGYTSEWGHAPATDPIPLEEVPPLVFSEVLRDVDLFVGVASVGNDPTWQDGGPQGHYRDYWHSYSFGELSATAETRKQLLERLVPRLTIAGRCSIEGRFLKVRGDLRTYKIHLGSGNILMEPNDQYLCIVPGRSAATAQSDKVFLPFEGDSVFSIILSKAFLLADDRKITDPTITHQIKV